VSFIKRVADSSALTKAQMESLLLYKRVMAGELTLKQAAKLRSPPVSTGAFYRVVKQGRDNVRSAIVTVTAGIWLGYLKPEDLRRLFNLLSNSPSPFEQEQSEELLQVLEALVDKIVV
jgi:hypothetical protein